MMPNCQQGLHCPTQLSLAAPVPPTELALPEPHHSLLIPLSALSSCSGHRYVPLPLCVSKYHPSGKPPSHIPGNPFCPLGLYSHAILPQLHCFLWLPFSFKQWGGRGGDVCQDGMVHPTSSHQSWLSHKGSAQVLYTGPLLPPPVPTCLASSLHNPFSSKATFSPKRGYL